MKKKFFIFISLFLILNIILISCYNYNKLPDKIASHWDKNGEINGYSSKTSGLILIPILIILITLFSLIIPIIAPNKVNILKFEKEFFNFMFIFLTFLSFIQIFIIYTNLGYNLSIIKILSIMFFIIFFYSGKLLKHSKQNFFIGIKTPWTLKNKKVWNKTHKLGSKLFKISGFLCLLGLIFHKLAIFFLITPIILTSIFLYIYSYIIYIKLKNYK